MRSFIKQLLMALYNHKFISHRTAQRAYSRLNLKGA